MIEIVCADGWLSRRRFYLFAHELYRGETKWEEPAVWGGRRVLDKGCNEVMCGPHVLMMAVEGKNVLARMMTGAVGDAGFFAMFDAKPCEAAVRKLMGEAAAWQRRMGTKKMVGPIAPIPVDLGGGVLRQGFERSPAYGDVYNAPYYGEMLERCGFETESEWLSYRVEAKRFEWEKYRRISEWTKRRFDLTVRCDLNGRPRELAEVIGYVMGEAENQERMNRAIGRLTGALADGLCPVVYCKAGPIGFLLTVRAEGKRPRILTMWVREEWRRMGVTAILFDAFMGEMDKRGITDVDASQVRLDNIASRRSIEMAGGQPIHRYRQYGMLI